jgi:hypothetical protein
VRKDDTNCSYHIDPGSDAALLLLFFLSRNFFSPLLAQSLVITFSARRRPARNAPNDCCDKVHARQIAAETGRRKRRFIIDCCCVSSDGSVDMRRFLGWLALNFGGVAKYAPLEISIRRQSGREI